MPSPRFVRRFSPWFDRTPTNLTLEGGYDRPMKVRIGIANTDKLIEIEVDDAKSFRKEMEKAIEGNGLGWFTDARGRSVGIPARNVAFIEIEDTEDSPAVGFAPAS